MAAAKPGGTEVQRCLVELRQMIISGALLPGQKVYQSEIAARLNVSRIPVREALSNLQAEGVVTYKAHTGFTVARFSGEDLIEIYLMRRLLETEILRSIDLQKVDVVELEALNAKLASLSPATDPDEYQDTNHTFHFRLFEYSELKLVIQEVQRLWYMSSFYRSLFFQEADSRLRVYDDHAQIIDAIRDGDVERLIQSSDHHRGATESLVTERIGWSRPRRSEA
ncbi:GntR family transcriptional regulator [Nocardioides houyundeii]|uniref:GntR family transcriptional regulator n=1 Tax=Nocardioides houyundeii TaxID=2045452 RepID=UPI000DF440C3|nr:GntR family transcriptional regulator [Nocardioides houyundeii]